MNRVGFGTQATLSQLSLTVNVFKNILLINSVILFSKDPALNVETEIEILKKLNHVSIIVRYDSYLDLFISKYEKSIKPFSIIKILAGCGG